MTVDIEKFIYRAAELRANCDDVAKAVTRQHEAASQLFLRMVQIATATRLAEIVGAVDADRFCGHRCIKLLDGHTALIADAWVLYDAVADKNCPVGGREVDELAAFTPREIEQACRTIADAAKRASLREVGDINARTARLAALALLL